MRTCSTRYNWGCTYADGQKCDSLVHTAQRGDIDGLATDGTLRTDTGGVFTGTSVDNGIDENLVSRLINSSIHLPVHITRTYLNGVLVGEEVDDLKRVRDNADRKELLAVVASLHHQAMQHPYVYPLFFVVNMIRTYLSTKRSTIGICAFLNCFLA